MGETEHTIRLLPDAPLSDDTEFVFVDGRAFVNVAKHEQVVDRHVASLRGAVERVTLVEQALLIACENDEDRTARFVQMAQALVHPGGR